jgi:hypothetical protein
MERRRSRWLLRIGVVLVVGLALLIWAIHEQSQDLLTIENRSGQPITLLRVTIAGESKTFKDVAKETAVTAPLGGKGDAGFVVEGQLADGTRIRGQFLKGGGRRLLVLPEGRLELGKAGRP